MKLCKIGNMENSSKYSKTYILFDWDGCLAKTLDIWLDVYKEVVKKRGIEVENELDFVEKSFGKWEKGFEDVGVKDAVVAYKEALQLVENRMPTVELYPNARELLNALKENDIKMSLITSSFRHLVEPALNFHNLTDFFECIITKDETKIGKPDPWLVDTALEIMHGNKEKSLIIGDSDHDILTGHNAGITSVLSFPEHNTKFYRKEFLIKHNPDYIIKDLLELLNVIK